jgi:hypothetical protein
VNAGRAYQVAEAARLLCDAALRDGLDGAGILQGTAVLCARESASLRGRFPMPRGRTLGRWLATRRPIR